MVVPDIVFPTIVKSKGGNRGEDNFLVVAEFCFNNDKIYESLHLAAEELNLSRGNIYHCCTGKYKQTKGYRFRYEP